jgi:hypothetical protein
VDGGVTRIVGLFCPFSRSLLRHLRIHR